MWNKGLLSEELTLHIGLEVLKLSRELEVEDLFCASISHSQLKARPVHVQQIRS